MRPGLPRFSRSSASVYYTERKPKNKKWGRPGNEAIVMRHSTSILCHWQKMIVIWTGNSLSLPWVMIAVGSYIHTYYTVQNSCTESQPYFTTGPSPTYPKYTKVLQLTYHTSKSMDFHMYTQVCSLCFQLHSAYKLGGDCYVAYHSIGSFGRSNAGEKETEWIWKESLLNTS